MVPDPWGFARRMCGAWNVNCLKNKTPKHERYSSLQRLAFGLAAVALGIPAIIVVLLNGDALTAPFRVLYEVWPPEVQFFVGLVTQWTLIGVLVTATILLARNAMIRSGKIEVGTVAIVVGGGMAPAIERFVKSFDAPIRRAVRLVLVKPDPRLKANVVKPESRWHTSQPGKTFEVSGAIASNEAAREMWNNLGARVAGPLAEEALQAKYVVQYLPFGGETGTNATIHLAQRLVGAHAVAVVGGYVPRPIVRAASDKALYARQRRFANREDDAQLAWTDSEPKTVEVPQ